MGTEALVICGDKITVMDMETGERIMQIPSCSSPSNGVLCLKDQYLVASQVNKHGSVATGEISFWPLNKPKSPLRSYPIEAIGPLASTKDGVYLAGGTPSGYIYLWEVIGGKLLKTWPAHFKSLSCLVFSNDDSFLTSGSDDGTIHVWPMISLLDVEDYKTAPAPLHRLSGHRSRITSLLSPSGRSCRNNIISSSLDGTCQIWDLVSGRLIWTQIYEIAITVTAFHPDGQILFSGSEHGRIFINMLDIAQVKCPIVREKQPDSLDGHNNPITALAFSRCGLISASKDYSICLWDVISGAVIRRFEHKKGAITNLLVIPRLSLSSQNCRGQDPLFVSFLDKFPQNHALSETTTFLSSCGLPGEEQTIIEFQSANTLKWQTHNLELEQTPEAMQMKIETSLEKRKLATDKAKHVMEMNMHLQSQILNLIETRLLQESDADSRPSKKLKKSPLINEETKAHSQA